MAENEDVRAQVESRGGASGRAWIGGYFEWIESEYTGRWRWTEGGESFPPPLDATTMQPFSNWAPGEPAVSDYNSRVEIRSNGLWYAVNRINSARIYVCHGVAPPPTPPPVPPAAPPYIPRDFQQGPHTTFNPTTGTCEIACDTSSRRLGEHSSEGTDSSEERPSAALRTLVSSYLAEHAKTLDKEGKGACKTVQPTAHITQPLKGRAPRIPFSQ